jgi:chromosome segregation ATPase
MKVIGTIKPLGNNPVVENKDVAGGIKIVKTIQDMYKLNAPTIENGSLVYVTENKLFYIATITNGNVDFSLWQTTGDTSDATADYQKLLEQINAVSDEVDTANNTSKDAFKLAEEASTSIANLKTTVDSHTSTLATYNSAHVSMNTQIATNKSDISKLNTSITNTDTTVSGLSNTLDSVQATIGGYSEKINKIDTIEDSIGSINTKITSNENKLSTQQSQIASINTSVSALQENIDNMATSDTIKDINTKISTIETSVSANTKSITTTNSNVTTLTKTVESNKSSVDSQITSINNSLTTANSNITSLQNKVSGYDSSISNINTSIGTINSNITNVQETVGKYEEEIESVGNSVDVLIQNSLYNKPKYTNCTSATSLQTSIGSCIASIDDNDIPVAYLARITAELNVNQTIDNTWFQAVSTSKNMPREIHCILRNTGEDEMTVTINNYTSDNYNIYVTGDIEDNVTSISGGTFAELSIMFFANAIGNWDCYIMVDYEDTYTL